MAQIQGSSSATGGRIDGSLQMTAPAAADFALGAGWGTTATVAVRAGSTDQRGVITITSSGTGQAQATATVTFTFKDGTFAAIPPGFAAVLINSSNAITETGATATACTATALSWTHSVLPVATKTYSYAYFVIA